jgi:Sulfotransferase family
LTIVSGPSPDPAVHAPSGDPLQRPKVVYVMGAGRSGSTILGTALGNCANIFFCGELARWHRRSGKPLAGVEREQFWRAVRQEVEIDAASLGPDVRYLQQSSNLFRVATWPAQRRLRERFRRASEDLYRAIARTSEATYVVDTSHFPRRARELQSLGGIDLYLLFLVRDPQSVVASYGRRDVVQGPKFNTLATNAYLWLTYSLSLLIFLRQPRERRLFVRHEAFIADPERVLREILDRIGSSADLPDLTALRMDLAFLGNRMVRGRVVALDRQPTVPLKQSRITTLLQLPWRAVFSRLQPRATNSRAPGLVSERAPKAGRPER